MNLMFRKNFREGASKAGGGGGKLQSKANRTKRSRDMGLVQQPEEIHYRTHLFFSPTRPGYDVGEGKLPICNHNYIPHPTLSLPLSLSLSFLPSLSLCLCFVFASARRLSYLRSINPLTPRPRPHSQPEHLHRIQFIHSIQMFSFASVECQLMCETNMAPIHMLFSHREMQ